MNSTRMNTVLKICEILTDEEITKTAKQSLQGAAITGFASFAGALLLGRKGILAGSVVGGLVSYLMGDEFKSAIEIYRSMSQAKKLELYNNVSQLMKNVPLESVAAGMTYLSSHQDVKSALQTEINSFLGSQMSF